MSKTLSTMTIIQQKGHATTNFFSRCVLEMEMIQHLYQFTYKGSCDIWTVSVDILRKWSKAQNTDPNISIILVDTLLYIVVEINDLPQFSKYHSKLGHTLHRLNVYNFMLHPFITITHTKNVFQ